MWWVRPAIVVQKPSTPSLTAACPMAGSMLAKRNRTSGVRCEMNWPASMPSMSAKMGATSRAMVQLLRRGGRLAGGFGVGEEGLGRRRAPQVRRDVPVAGYPAVVDLVDVGEPLDPRAPRVGVVVEEVRSDGMAAYPPARLAALAAHAVGADRDRVDGRDLETGVVEAAVGAGDEAEDVVVAWSGVEEGHQVVVDRVAEPQPQHLGVELRHPGRLRGEQQRVPEPPGQDVAGGLPPLGDVETLAGAADVDQDLGDGPGRRLRLVQQLHGRPVRVAQPQ